VNADGSGLFNLTDYPDASELPVDPPVRMGKLPGGEQVVFGHDREPAWSPDGSKIAFSSDRDRNNEIYVINADGTGLKNLTNSPDSDTRPVWSPDGSKIAFVGGGIYVVNADGTGLTNLTTYSPGANGSPVWSPDGSRIAFLSDRGGSREIYVMNADGTGLVRLHNAWTEPPTWSPDGTAVAFVSAGGIYLMSADGTDLFRLPTGVLGVGKDWAPAWSPVQ
ncbi:MAG: PD40 domain-containing protein, partial [Chloroflexi bacterium]|nr:PD40 domain-containing protein [Chloroflexota bacterium]